MVYSCEIIGEEISTICYCLLMCHPLHIIWKNDYLLQLISSELDPDLICVHCFFELLTIRTSTFAPKYYMENISCFCFYPFLVVCLF